VSLDATSVVSQVQALEAKGMREVVLTGVNLCQYAGEYQGGHIDFAALLELILEQTVSIALRISSLHPNHIDGRLCRIIQNIRVRPHFHLSVQSGSDAVLAAMKRSYTAADTLDAVLRLRAAKKNPFIACDIIAGFPGESAGDFEKTLELCRKSDFAWIHAFPFSPRPGTAAFTMKGSVQSSVVRERVQTLQSLAVANKIAYIKSFEGKTLPVITEHADKSRDLLGSRGLLTAVHGVTENFIHVEIPGHAETCRIVKTLETRIQNGDEVEALAEFVF
jgi:threonylcarbamoyladenosine tRNA methylthiotransferase MtaB